MIEGNDNNMYSCKRCLMNSTVKDFELNSDSCNYCDLYERNLLQSSTLLLNKESAVEVAEKIKNLSKTRKGSYDLIFGLSGGLDSCYALHLIAELGLRPLVVHMDNGWNSELAQSNIEKMIDKLGFDLETNVLDWQTYKKLQLAFLASDVIDIEILYDQAATSTCYAAAKKHNISFISGGTNNSSEGFRMPSDWAATNKLDVRSIKSIWEKYGDGSSISNYPFYSTMDSIVSMSKRKIKWFSVLDYYEYNKDSATSLLIEKYDFTPYPFKHYESVFTRFYQGYILPNKFKVDKRLVHLSSLILSNQITREEAQQSIRKNPYPDEVLLNNDIRFFMKKIGWNQTELELYLKRPGRSYSDFKSEHKLIKLLFNLVTVYYRFRNSELTLGKKAFWIIDKFILRKFRKSE